MFGNKKPTILHVGSLNLKTYPSAGMRIEHLYIQYNKILVDKYKARVDPMHSFMINKNKRNHEVAKLRDFLLPLPMNGQVTIKQDPSHAK